MILAEHFLAHLKPVKTTKKVENLRPREIKWDSKRKQSTETLIKGMEQGLCDVPSLSKKIDMSPEYTKTILRELLDCGRIRKEGKNGLACKYFLV